ncbi:MAG: branched-chain amino acid ABC transporter permease [Jatrophihabitans sp.]|nr:MAG: branched-chain amino acid ABC transporter permease [Jatrophihabitans sp.]
MRRKAIRSSVALGVAVGAYGVAFGAASVAAGLSVLQSCLLSLLAFTGGSQFAVVGVIAGGGSPAAALASGLLLGSRNTLYAMRLAPLLRPRPLVKPLAALGTIDESTAMAIAWLGGGPPARSAGPAAATAGGQEDPRYGRVAFWWTFGSVFVVWNLATLAGAAGTSALGDPGRFGLDAVVPVAFLALLAPRLRQGALERSIAVTAVVIAAVLIPLTPPGVPVLAACAALLLAGVLR